MRLIQSHLDRYGVKEAEFARRIGTMPQTVNSWKKRGLKTLPERRLLQAVSEVTKVPYLVVLDAALVDSNYRESMADDLPTIRSRIARLVRQDGNVARDLINYLETPYVPDLPNDLEVTAGMELDDRDRLVEELINQAYHDVDTYGEYANDTLLIRDDMTQYLEQMIWNRQRESGATEANDGQQGKEKVDVPATDSPPQPDAPPEVHENEEVMYPNRSDLEVDFNPGDYGLAARRVTDEDKPQRPMDS